MRLSVKTFLAVVGVSAAMAGGAAAMPLGEAPLNQGLAKASPIEPARLYCFNRFTGQFLHWGPCWRRVYYYRPHFYYYHRPHWHHFYY